MNDARGFSRFIYKKLLATNQAKTPGPNPNDAGKIATTLSFLASAIRSGEKWSPECDHMLREAYDALYRIANGI